MYRFIIKCTYERWIQIELSHLDVAGVETNFLCN
jgi:hypothetical protein